MRLEAQPIHEDTGATGYTFHFQISNSGRRQACSVKVQAETLHDATMFFRQNWPMIETMARNGLANGLQGRIQLAVSRDADTFER
jgi:hypothetical protein